jgi:uncharacterized membrane protein YjdF
LGHFLVGVFAYPAVEISLRKQWVNNRLMAWLFGVFYVLGVLTFFFLTSAQHPVK